MLTPDILHAVLEHAPESLVVLDHECRILAFNQGLSKLLYSYFGKSPQVGDSYIHFVPKPHIETFNSTFQEAWNGSKVEFDAPTEHNGQTYWFRNQLTSFQNSSGETVGVIFASKNITQEMWYHQALEIQASAMQDLFDQASESMILLDLDAKIIQINQFAKESIERLRNKVPEIGRYFPDYLDSQNKPLFDELFQQAAEGIPTEKEMSALSVDHQLYWFKTRLNPIYHADGKLLGVTVVSEYITEKKQVETYLKESEARFRSILQAIPLPIVLLDPQTQVAGVNHYAERLFQWREAEVLGLNLDVLIPPQFREDLMMSSWESFVYHLTEPETTHEVLEVYLPNQTQKSFFEVYANDFEFRGKAQTVLMFSDITSHIQSSKVIHNQLEILREVAFIQSHVIRSPLAKILGIVDLLTQESEISSEDRKEWLALLSESAGELDEVIQQLVDRIGR